MVYQQLTKTKFLNELMIDKTIYLKTKFLFIFKANKDTFELNG